MPLTVGSRLGHYDVTALIGEGGMGQVYQATDTKLKRQVALKILPEAFSADPERLARFQREAEVLASLNHPNIAAIHSLEEADDTRALVLELVEGPTLADRIKRGPIPLDEGHCQVDERSAKLRPDGGLPSSFISRHTSPPPIRRRPAFAASGDAPPAADVGPPGRDSAPRRGPTRSVADGRPT